MIRPMRISSQFGFRSPLFTLIVCPILYGLETEYGGTQAISIFSDDDHLLKCTMTIAYEHRYELNDGQGQKTMLSTGMEKNIKMISGVKNTYQRNDWYRKV